MEARSEVTLQWLGAAHFHITWQDTRVVVDPLYSRLPGEKPVLEARRENAEPMEHLLLTHGHLDHSADFPYLLTRHQAEAYAPAEVFHTLRHQGIEVADRRCHPLEGLRGTTVPLGGAKLTPHRIGTEQIDLWFIRAMFARPWRHRRPQAIPFGLRWMAHHLFCNCFAFHLHFETEDTTMLFFGNLPPHVDELHSVENVDVLAIPYCPANNKWKQQSVQLIKRFRPGVTLVHHFDNFMHPFTLCKYMDLGNYQKTITEQVPGTRLVFAKFNQQVPLREIRA